MKVTLGSVTANYTQAELKFMRRLWRRSRHEAMLIHTAKALFDGRLK